MSIVIYAEGNTHNINGIDCTIKLIDPELFNGTLEKGWFLQPEELYTVEPTGEIEMACKPTKKPKKKPYKKGNK